MVASDSILVTLLRLVERLPLPPRTTGGRGRPPQYSDRLMLKALVVMIIKGLPTVHLFWEVVHQPTNEMQQVRALLTEQGRFPCRRTWERRLATLPAQLPKQIAALGDHLVTLIQPWQQDGCAAAIDSTVLRAKGGVWHKHHREANLVPHTSIDTEAHWTKSGWHGWVYGWKLHVIVSVAAVWIPLAAEVTAANAADNETAFVVLDRLLTEIHLLLGDTAYNDPELRASCETNGINLVASRRGDYPHEDGGVEVRRIFHQLRSHAIENFNGQFKAIFDADQPVPTRGLTATRRWVLGAILVYQLALWCRFEAGQELRVGLKPFLRAA